MDKDKVKQETENWLRTFIIKYSICPFAKKEHDQNRIRYAVFESGEIENCLENLIRECLFLDNNPEIETSLLIFPKHFIDFDDYLDFLNLAESLMIAQSYEGIYQLASFHPDYCFDGENPNDPANYTNRSPYPMLHLIREQSLEQALNTFSQPENIPNRNIRLTREMGLKKLQAILKNCYKIIYRHLINSELNHSTAYHA